MDDANFNSDATAMTLNRRSLLEKLAIIRSLFRKESSADDDDATAAAARNRNVVEGRAKEGVRLINDQMAAVSTELLLTVMSDMMLLRLLDGLGLEEGRAVASSDEASDQQSMDADAAKKKRAVAKQKEKKKRYKRNKAAAKQKKKETTKLMSWLGGGLISLLTMIAFGSIMTFVVPLSLIHQTDGSGEGNAPPALPPSASKPLRQKDIQSNTRNVASVSLDISHPLAAVVPPPVFSPSAVTVSNRRMKSDANATFNEIERNALIDFYDSTKGAEWMNTTNWLDEDASYCNWWGVTCDKTGHVTELVLADNSLWGTLSESIGNLTFIEVLDLSDNDMKGSIPKEIGLLSNLTYLRLSYNAFTGAAPESLRELTKLQLVHLQSNRITEVPNMLRLDESIYNTSTFVADCGVLTAFNEALQCEHCTMCCNANEDCYPQEGTQIAEHLGLSYGTIGILLIASFAAFCCIVALSLYLFNKSARESNYEADKYALSRIGEASVYCFFVTNKVLGWLVASVTLAIQVWILAFFLIASEANLQDDEIDIQFTWKCPPDSDVCKEGDGLTKTGWFISSMLMIAFLATDMISGCKFMYHSSNVRRTLVSRIRWFVAGLCLCSVTIYSFYVSTVYNQIVSKNNADLIVNSVIILFVMEIDERVFSALAALNGKWTASHVDYSDSSSASEIEEMKEKIESQEKELGILLSQQKEITLRMEEMKKQTDEIASQASESTHQCAAKESMTTIAAESKDSRSDTVAEKG